AQIDGNASIAATKFEWCCLFPGGLRLWPGRLRPTFRSSILTQAVKDAVAEGQRRRWWRRRWIMWTGGAFVVLAIVAALGVMWGLRQMEPLMKKRVVETLSARFHSPVELDRLSLSMRKGVVVTGGGLRILYLAGPTKPDGGPNAPAML